MYYPYLRGKQFELILLRDNSLILAKNHFHPIIEPVKTDFKSLFRALERLEKDKAQYTLILNPQAGKDPVPIDVIIDNFIEKSLTTYENMSLGYIMNASSDIKNLEMIIKKYKQYSFSIIHYGYTQGKELYDVINGMSNIKRHVFIDGFAGKLYQRHFRKMDILKILIRDGFKRQKNADYPVSEHFSDLHVTYDDENMKGFGDFLIVGDDYSESGGPAHAVAVHLTYLDSEDDMFVYHFKSVRTKSPADPAGKFLEALQKLKTESKKRDSPLFLSNACNEFIELCEKKHFPGLGVAKKLSMQHHIELIANFLSRD